MELHDLGALETCGVEPKVETQWDRSAKIKRPLQLNGYWRARVWPRWAHVRGRVRCVLGPFSPKCRMSVPSRRAFPAAPASSSPSWRRGRFVPLYGLVLLPVKAEAS